MIAYLLHSFFMICISYLFLKVHLLSSEYFRTLKRNQHNITKIYNKQKLQTTSPNKLNVKESNNSAGILHDVYLIVILFFEYYTIDAMLKRHPSKVHVVLIQIFLLTLHLPYFAIGIIKTSEHIKQCRIVRHAPKKSRSA